MKEGELNKKLRELIDIASNKNPKEKTSSKQKETDKPNKSQIEKLAKSMQELSILLKYLLFDLEATRRERDKYKSMLENQPPTDLDHEV